MFAPVPFVSASSIQVFANVSVLEERSRRLTKPNGVDALYPVVRNLRLERPTCAEGVTRC